VCELNREVEDTDRRVVHRTNLLEKKGGIKKYLHGIIIEERKASPLSLPASKACFHARSLPDGFLLSLPD